MTRALGIDLLLALTISLASSSPVTPQCGKPADVVIAIDTSSSIWPHDFYNYVLTFVQSVVSMFDIGPHQTQTRVGVVTFSNDVHLELNLNSYYVKSQLLTAIARIKFRGGETYTDKALNYAHENMFNEWNGGRPNVTHIIIVITDGKSSYHNGTLREAEAAKRKGAAIFAIGVGQADERELDQIASQPSSQFKFRVTDFSVLDSIKIKLALEACEVTMAPATTTSTTAASTITSTETTNATTSPTITSRPTEITTATTSPTAATTPIMTQDEQSKECRRKPADIFFILDSSSSIRKMDFEKRMLGFIRDVVSSFNIGQDRTRVGIMTFNDRPKLVIGLDAYSEKQELLDAISPRIVRYTLGGTNTGNALRDVRTIGFHESVSREGVAKIAIVITDGQSWDEQKTKKEAELLKKSGVMVYAIGVGGEVMQEEVEAIASEPKENFVFSVDGFAALSELKDVLTISSCEEDNPQNDLPVCGSRPTDITIAFDANIMRLATRQQTISQVQALAERLSDLGGDIKLGVTSGSCPSSMDLPLTKSDAVYLKIRQIKKNIKSSILKIVKEWRYKAIGNLKEASAADDDNDLPRHDQEPSFGTTKKGFVLILHEENRSEFKFIAEEVLLLIENGVDILLVLDKAIDPHEAEKWQQLLSHKSVISGIDLDTDYSGYIMEFMCSL